MTKSAKHKKEFRREKNKIKLKLTAKLDKSVRKKKGSLLPKGLNVTDTSFKTKKIIIPENLRPSEDSGIPLSHRKQSFKVIIPRIFHSFEPFSIIVLIPGTSFTYGSFQLNNPTRWHQWNERASHQISWSP